MGGRRTECKGKVEGKVGKAKAKVKEGEGSARDKVEESREGRARYKVEGLKGKQGKM